MYISILFLMFQLQAVHSLLFIFIGLSLYQRLSNLDTEVSSITHLHSFHATGPTTMHRSSIAKLSLLALISPVFTTLITPPQIPPSQSGTTLHPLKPADYETSIGVQRRALNDLSAMNPRNQTHLIYGSTKGTSTSG